MKSQLNSNKRRHKHTKLLQVQIRMIEDEWYDRLNKAIYKQNTNTIG